MSSESGFDVMHQFKIEKVLDLHLFGIDISLTNSGVTAMFISASLMLMAFFGLRSKNPKMLFILEKIYSSVNGIVQNNIGEESKKYINFIFSLFIFISFANLFGLFGFAITSHIAVTFAMSAVVFLVTLFVLIKSKGMHAVSHFIPHGTPKIMAPLVMFLEMISFLIRPLSLSLRLGINIMAGHIILEVICLFCVMMGIFGLFPFLFSVVISCFEFGVCILQAYIFTLLTSVYIGEITNGH
jgi:F-type H+-transporting ATPase subunit a